MWRCSFVTPLSNQSEASGCARFPSRHPTAPACLRPQEAQQQAKQSQLKAATMLGAAGMTGPNDTLPVGPCKLYVANLNAAIGEPDVQQLFAPFGHIDSVQLVRDTTGRSQVRRRTAQLGTLVWRRAVAGRGRGWTGSGQLRKARHGVAVDAGF